MPFGRFTIRQLTGDLLPKKWPDRGSLWTKFDVRLIDPSGAARPVAMKEVFAGDMESPFDPRPGGNVGGFPKLQEPLGFVFVPAASVAPGYGAA